MLFMSFVPHIGMALVLCGVLASSCARSSFDPPSFLEGGQAQPTPEDGGEVPVEDAGSISPADSGPADAARPPLDSGPIFATDSGAHGNDSSTPLDSGTLDAGPRDSGPGTIDSGPMFVCTAVNACESARTMSAIRGDVDAQVSSTTGSISEWLNVTIVDVGGLFNPDRTLKARITLRSPANSNYDLFVHRPDEAGGNAIAPKDCSVAPVSSQSTSGEDVVALSWQDTTNFFGETAGDGLVLSIEVRHVGGPCDQPWSLYVQGNTI